MNSFSILEEEEEDYVQKTSVEYFKFVSLATDIRVDIQDKPLEFSSKDSSVSLIACSIKNGYFIAASNQGFVYGETAVLRKGFYNAPKGKNISFTDKIEVNVSSPVLQLRLSYDESHIIVGTSRALLIYQLSDIQTDRENVKPVKEWNLDEEIMDVRPNTESHPNLVAILFSNNQCRIMDMMDGTTQCQLPSEDITALCWSPKGRQIVCGRKNGYLEHYDISGNKKDSLPIPSAVSTENEEEPADRYVKDVLWIDNNTFLPIYARERSNEEDEFVFDGFIINRKPHSEDGPQYTRLAELTPIFSNGGHGDHFYMEIIHNLGEEIKCMVVIANAASTEISVVGQDADGEWSTWEIPEGGEILLPLSEETFMDTYPVGLALDFAPNETLPPLDASIDETRVQPMPILYVLNDEAKVSAYHCYNITLARTGGTYKPPASVSTSTVSSSSTPAPSIPAASTAPASTAPASTTPSAFGSFASTQGTSSFSDLLSGKTKSVSSDGFGGFGGQTTASIPSFQNLGSSQKLAPIMSSPLTAKPNFSNTPSFGSTSNIGFGTTTPLGFGSGTMSSAMTDKPLASFKSSSTAEDKTDKPAATTFTAFGQSEATSVDKTAEDTSIKNAGSLSFGSFAKNPVTGATTAPAFGSTSALGTSSFGSLAKNTVFGASSTTPAFGSTSTPGTSSFGSLAKNTVPGATAPSTTPAFGSTSTPGTSSFGSLAKNTVPGAKAPSTTPTFGSTSTLGTSSFGSLAKNTAPGAKAPSTTPTFGSTSTLGTSSFGSLAKNTVPGATAPSTTPAFGSPSTLGASSFGSLTKSIVSGEKTPSTTTVNTSTALNSISPQPSSSSVSTSNKPDTESKGKDQEESTTSKDPGSPIKGQLKPVATDGMALEYEKVFLKVMKDIEELSLRREKICIVVDLNTQSTTRKTESDIPNSKSTWQLQDNAALGSIVDDLNSRVQSELDETLKKEQKVEELKESISKLHEKKEDFKALSRRELDGEMVELMYNCDLDTESQVALDLLAVRSENYADELAKLEYKLQQIKKRSKLRIQSEGGEMSLYSLHRAIRDIEKDIASKSSEIKEIADKLAETKLDNTRLKNQELAGEESGSQEEEGYQLKSEVIQSTTKYIRRIQFMNSICDEFSQIPPLQVNMN